MRIAADKVISSRVVYTYTNNLCNLYKLFLITNESSNIYSSYLPQPAPAYQVTPSEVATPRP